jgi:MoxR-like ATPase
MYDKRTETFHYVPGAASDANLLLGDEINRTSSKTQSALLEAMEEGQVTVDGIVHPLEKPFCVIATQNQVGTVGTQPLPQAQMDRFLVRLTMGYPDLESQMTLIRDRQTEDPMNRVARISDREGFLRMQAQARDVTMKEELISYIARLSEASREHPSVQLGLSPRGALALSRMAKASAYLRGRDYVIVEDVQTVAQDVCAHRLVLTPKARLDKVTPSQIVAELLARVPVPNGLT